MHRGLFPADIGDDRHDLGRRNARANAGCCRLHRLGIAVDEDHAAALLAKQHAGGDTYSTGASRYDGNFALKASAHANLRMLSIPLLPKSVFRASKTQSHAKSSLSLTVFFVITH